MNSKVLTAKSNTNGIFTFQQPRQQAFPLPFPIIKYFFTNPTSHRVWKQIIKTCKYFFSKNHVYPIQFIEALEDGNWIIDGAIFDLKESAVRLWLFNKIELPHNRSLSELPNDIVSILIPKIYKCELRYLQLRDQNLTWSEYQFLTSSGTIETFNYWRKTTVKYSDGTLVTCDKLIGNLRYVKKIEINCSKNPSMFKPNTVREIIRLLSDRKYIVQFNLTMLPECFDFSLFTHFLMGNKNVKRIYLNFEHVSEVFKRTLEEYIDKTIANPCKVIPFIRYSGFEGDRFLKYYRLYQKFKTQ